VRFDKNFLLCKARNANRWEGDPAVCSFQTLQFDGLVVVASCISTGGLSHDSARETKTFAWSLFGAVCITLIGLYLTVAPATSRAVEPLVKSDCPSQTVCLWEGPTFGGKQSFWHAYETGCHALTSINPQSLFNNTTNRTLKLPQLNQLGGNEFGPGVAYHLASPYSGEACIF
jgi:hypothetical protein